MGPSNWQRPMQKLSNQMSYNQDTDTRICLFDEIKEKKREVRENKKREKSEREKEDFCRIEIMKRNIERKEFKTGVQN